MAGLGLVAGLGLAGWLGLVAGLGLDVGPGLAAGLDEWVELVVRAGVRVAQLADPGCPLFWVPCAVPAAAPPPGGSPLS